MKCRILKSNFTEELERKINQLGMEGWHLLSVMVLESQLVAVLVKEGLDVEESEGTN